jgi:hypothetical protein
VPSDESDTLHVRCPKPDPVGPSRALGVEADDGSRCRVHQTLMGSALPFEAFAKPRNRYLVHGTRFVV